MQNWTLGMTSSFFGLCSHCCLHPKMGQMEGAKRRVGGYLEPDIAMNQGISVRPSHKLYHTLNGENPMNMPIWPLSLLPCTTSSFAITSEFVPVQSSTGARGSYIPGDESNFNRGSQMGYLIGCASSAIMKSSNPVWWTIGSNRVAGESSLPMSHHGMVVQRFTPKRRRRDRKGRRDATGE